MSSNIYFTLPTTKEAAATAVQFQVEANLSLESPFSIRQKFRTAANIEENVTLKLYDAVGCLVNFASIVANSPAEPYSLRFLEPKKPVESKAHQDTMKVLFEISALSKHVIALTDLRVAAMVIICNF